MASVNKAIVLGNIGRDPEVRYSASGSAVCNLSIATTRKWKSKDGEAQEETEWHRVVFYDRLAEVADEYLGKGSAVYVEGRLKTRKWQDKDGIDRYTTEIVGEHMQMLGGRGGGGADGPGSDGGESPAPRRSAPPRAAAGAPATATRPAAKPATGFDDMDDDIPF